MIRTVVRLRTVPATALLGVALVALPAAAEAAKVKVTGGIVRVDDDGVAAIKLANPNSKAAKGTLSLSSEGTRIGSQKFKIRARRSATVKVGLSLDALLVLAQGDDLPATASAKAKRNGTSRKSLLLTYPGASNGGGTNDGSGTDGGTPSGGQQPATAPWADGRWQGTYSASNADLAFNVVGNRLYTGPFDSFYVESVCEYNTDAIAMEPVEATIGPDGNFSGSGVYRPSATASVPWTISGHISGQRLTGTLSVSYSDSFHGACSGRADFTAVWYGDYTL